MSLYAIYDNGLLVPVQQGHGLDGLAFYRTDVYRQRGNGIGNFFAKLAGRLLPFVKSTVLPHAKAAAMNIGRDILDGGSFKESLRNNGLQAMRGIGTDILDNMSRPNQSGSGFGRKRKRRSSVGPPKKKQKLKRKVSKRKPKRGARKPKRKSPANKGRKRNKRKGVQFKTLFD